MRSYIQYRFSSSRGLPRRRDSDCYAHLVVDAVCEAVKRPAVQFHSLQMARDQVRIIVGVLKYPVRRVLPELEVLKADLSMGATSFSPPYG